MTRLKGNWGVKASSLMLAVLLWVVIAGEKTSELGLSVPVELHNFPQDMELTGEPANTVEVRLRASPSVIQQLGPGQISAEVDLAGAVEGERIVHLNADAVRVPFGVQVVKITPSSLTLHLESTRRKLVPVRARLVGRPAAGFEVAEVLVDPAEVPLVGPKSRVQEVESAFTEPVALDGARADVIDRVNVGVDEPTLRVQGSPRVKVTARIAEVRATRTLTLSLTPDPGTPARTLPVRVRISGPASLVGALQPADLRTWLAPVPEAPARQRVHVEPVRRLDGLRIEHIAPAELPARGTRAAGGKQ